MKYERRLRKLAGRAGVCPIHPMIPLSCTACTVRDYECVVWHGTNDELVELDALMERSRRYYRQRVPHTPCPVRGCVGFRLCDTCMDAARAAVDPDDGVYSPEERRRYAELMRHLYVNGTPALDYTIKRGRG